MDINDIKKELDLSQNDIAEFFGYKDGGSYARSTRKKHVDNGIISIYKLTKKAWEEKNIKTVDETQTLGEEAMISCD